MQWAPLLRPFLPAAPTAGRTQVSSPADIHAHFHMADVMPAGTPNAYRMRWLLCIRTGLNRHALAICMLERRCAWPWLGLRSGNALKNAGISAPGIFTISLPQLMSLACAGLSMLAGVIVMLIAAILFRRILIISGADVTSLM